MSLVTYQKSVSTAPAVPFDKWCCDGCTRLSQAVNRKTIPIHMLYADGGSALYEEIEAHADYYLYATEKALLHRHIADIIRHLRPGTVVVELGCGDCTKTDILLRALAERDGAVDFVGVDSSLASLEASAVVYAGRPEVTFAPIHDNFFDGLATAVQRYRGRHICVILLGSTIGNMSFASSELFLRNVTELVSSNALGRSFEFILGLDMWKDPDLLQRAYDNKITREFELNGLRNSLRHSAPELLFDRAHWSYDVRVNAQRNQVEMYAVSLREQGAGGLSFAEGEQVLLEVSHKFRPAELEALFTGYELVASYGDDYRVAVLSGTAAAELNPWMSYSDEHIEHIDRVAAMDYDAFIRDYDWTALSGAATELDVLDVGCGSGFVPRALIRRTPASRDIAGRIAAYDLLDISANSLRIAASNIPFQANRKFHTSIQGLSESPHFATTRSAGYDIVWSIHGITAVPAAELWTALFNMLTCVKPGGKALIVVSDRDSHYAAIDRAYLRDREHEERPRRAPFLISDDVLALLSEHDIDHEVLRFETAYAFPAADVESWHRFNAWCVYDDAFDVSQAGPEVTAYVDSLVDRERGGFRLHLTSTAITIERNPLTLLRLLARRADASSLEESDYSRSCEAFERSSTQRRELVHHLARERILAELAALAPEPLQILSVGCGDGQMDAMLLDACLPEGCSAPIRYTGVDLSPVQIARCRALLEARAAHRARGPTVDFRVLQASAFEGLAPHERFDCILMLHVLYYVDDFRAHIRQAVGRLAAGGKLLIWQAPCEDMNQLSKVFWDPQHSHVIPFAADIEAFLRAEGLRFRAHRIDAQLDLQPEPATSERDDVLSFLLQVNYAQLPAALGAAVHDSLRELHARHGKIPHPVCCFVVDAAGAGS